MDRWRCLTTWDADPAFNMGLDEALLEDAQAPPTLRLYTWSPDTLSLGWFQRLTDVPGREQAGALVRRITGGGAIHHVEELTFSLAASLSHPLYAGSLRASYERVHAVLAAALAAAGVQAQLRGARALSSDRAGTGMCFHHSTDLDLVWDGRKGVGSAQRRKRGRVLHHGSIKLGSSPLEGDIATVRAHAPRLSPADLAALLRAAFEREAGLTLEPAEPTARERTRAATLGARYVAPEFVRRR